MASFYIVPTISPKEMLKELEVLLT